MGSSLGRLLHDWKHYRHANNVFASLVRRHFGLFLICLTTLNKLFLLSFRGVGFLRYFQLKQLPNFLLASPALSLAVYSIAHYTKMLYQLFQTSSIHKQIIAALEERSVESCKRSDVATVLMSELSAGLANTAQGTSEIKQRKSVATETASASSHNTVIASQNQGESG
uniref:GPI mannosyltransferase 2 n=1 Tax=Arundo donax TaxID=35708 RepID=A0A0A8Y9X3_ARUDO